MEKRSSMYLAIGALFSCGALLAACALPDPGTRIWNIVAEDLVTDCQTLSKVEIIDSKLDLLGACGSTPLMGNNITISSPGTYCLEEDVVGTVTITSSYVTLDLNGHSIVGGLNGVLINASLTDVTVRNGIIRDTLAEGVLVGDGCSFVTLNNLQVADCAQSDAQFGIDFAGLVGSRISDCRVVDTVVSDCSGGIRLLHADNNMIIRSKALSCVQTSTARGIAIEGDVTARVEGNSIDGCFVTTVSSIAMNAIGISIEYGQFTTVTDSVVQTVVGSSVCAGLASVSSIGTRIIRCQTLDIISVAPEIPFQVGAGIFIVQDENYFIDQATVNMVQLSTRGAGIGLLDTKHGVVQNSTISNVNLVSGESVIGIVIASIVGSPISGEDILIDNVTVENITAEIQALFIAAGFFCVGQPTNITVQNSVFSNIRSANAGLGMAIFQTGNICINNCKATGIQGNNPAIGIYVTDSHDCILNNCTSFNITNTDASDTAGFFLDDTLYDVSLASSSGSATGFMIQSTFECALNHCQSSNVLSAGSTAGGFILDNAQGVSIFNSVSQFNEADAPNASLSAGFQLVNSTDILVDFCSTMSNTINPLSGGVARGFDLSNATNVQIIDCISVQNDDEAYHLDASSGFCLVTESLATQSGFGFVDLAMTSTFINNVASLNGSPFSMANNYSGIPTFLIMDAGDLVIAGGNLSA